ncbi:DUF418 domain-containing protein [Actinopolyspora lacussalsi]|uniref:DUF418 domain-containing protein n=1 Tax=Actinopolyspora righensis TaxID=995060 RepID=UPI000B810450|nr:DUF418 domain-containing protein [Actinopolyspora righensis]
MTESTTSSETGLPTTARSPTARTGRLVGIDMARGLAVLGMFAAHTVPSGWLHTLVSGRSAALFAVLAGVSIALLSGGTEPHTGRRRTASAVRIAARAVPLFVLGLLLTSMQVPAMVILAFYGVLFLLAIPLLPLRATSLAVSAAVLAVVTPLVSFLVRSNMPSPKRLGYTPDLADFTSLEGVAEAFRAIVLTGAYPVLTWIPFLLAGMALGRLEPRVFRGRLVAIGAGLALLGYGVSWLALYVFGGFERIVGIYQGKFPPRVVEELLASNLGTVPTRDPAYLLTAGAHSGTPFEIIGAAGVALAVIGLCLFAERSRTVLFPLAAVGALALTCYAGHLLVLRALGPERLAPLMGEHPHALWLLLVTGALLCAALWRRFLGRGPLEWTLHRLTAALGKLIVRGNPTSAENSTSE